MLKAADVEFVGSDTIGAGLVTVVVTGEVGAVKAVVNFHTLHFTKHISASCIQKQRCKDQHTILQRCISLKYSPLDFPGSAHLIYICRLKSEA